MKEYNVMPLRYCVLIKGSKNLQTKNIRCVESNLSVTFILVLIFFNTSQYS